MKKTRLLGALLALCLSLGLLPMAALAAPASLTGTWEGYYYANQGQTGLTLTLNDDGTGVFEFYNMPGRSNAKNGSYTVRVDYDGDTIVIPGVEWIDRPSGYGFVTLYGTLSGDELTGNVDRNGSWPLYLVRDNAARQELDKTVFDGHKYERVDQGMTWTQAKAYCERQGGYLACVNSRAEQEYLQGLIAGGTKNMYWIGAYRTDYGFRWLDGSELTYANWDAGEPNNYQGDEAYAEMYRLPSPFNDQGRAGAWNDAPDDNAHDDSEFFLLGNVGFLCEWDAYSESSQWATPELQEAAEKGLIPDSLVGEDMTRPITRGEFAAVVVKLYEQLNSTRTVMSGEAKFKDIASDVNRNEILKAYNISAVRGVSETEYAPGVQLNREQMATMLCRVIKRSTWPEWTVEADGQDKYRLDLTGATYFADNDQISDYARESVYYMAKTGIILGKGDNRFAPRNATSQQEAEGYANATREQAVAISLRIYNQNK